MGQTDTGLKRTNNEDMFVTDRELGLFLAPDEAKSQFDSFAKKAAAFLIFSAPYAAVCSLSSNACFLLLSHAELLHSENALYILNPPCNIGYRNTKVPANITAAVSLVDNQIDCILFESFCIIGQFPFLTHRKPSLRFYCS